MPARKVKTVGWLARQAREAQGKSIEDIANDAEVTPRVVSEIERGVGAIPAKIEEVAPHLNLTYRQLIGLDPPPPLPDKIYMEFGGQYSLDDIVEKIRQRTGWRGEIAILGFYQSSTHLTLLIDEAGAFAILRAFLDQRLADLQCRRIEVPNSPFYQRSIRSLLPFRVRIAHAISSLIPWILILMFLVLERIAVHYGLSSIFSTIAFVTVISYTLFELVSTLVYEWSPVHTFTKTLRRLSSVSVDTTGHSITISHYYKHYNA